MKNNNELAKEFAVWCWGKEVGSDISKIESLFSTFLAEQELKEKDYEILSIIHVKTKNIFDKKKEDEFWSKTSNTWIGEFNLNTEYIINSIKRKSDNEIFTIGDKLYYNGYTGDGNFILKEIEFEKAPSDKGTGKLTFIHTHKLLCKWLDIEKLQKDRQPLFKTEDGVDIFEGDEYCYFRFHSWTCDMAIANEKFYSQDKFSTNSLYFSTKEKAEEYILMNKPCLSLNDLLNNWGEISCRPFHL